MQGFQLGPMTVMMRHLFVQVVALQPLCQMGFGGVCQAGLQPLVHISQGLDLHVHSQSGKCSCLCHYRSNVYAFKASTCMSIYDET